MQRKELAAERRANAPAGAFDADLSDVSDDDSDDGRASAADAAAARQAGEPQLGVADRPDDLSVGRSVQARPPA